ncbi:MAG: hypothetical protein K8T91_15250 [Planctomycetes bacterium]|nr:hypothetical protein [Planctomycetota bacterium]
MTAQQDVTVVQDVTCEADDIIAALRVGLGERVGATRADLWFGRRARLVVESDLLVVEVPNEFYRDWLRRNFRADLLAVSQSVLGRTMELEFRVTTTGSVGDVAEPAKSPQVDSPPQPSEASPNTLSMARGDVSDANAAHSRSQRPVSSAGNSAPNRRRPLAEMANFVVGPSNRLAYASAELAIRDLGRYTPLCVHGPTGVGKTHLLEGIYSAAARMQPRICAIYQTAEQFTSEFLESLHHSGLPSFRRKYRGVDLLVIDDIQFLAGKRATLVEVLHTLDTLLRQGRQVVVAADRAPAELTELGPELVARLSGGMACGMVAPEYDVRLGIVRRVAASLQMELPDDVASTIAARFSQHARQLIGAIHRLKAMGEVHARPITAALADEALADLTSSTTRGVQLVDIERAICDEFRLEGDALRSQNKGKTLSQPRALAMWLARKHTRSALSEIGSYFGRRSHTTVLAAHKRVEDLMARRGLDMQQAGQNIEATIRRVEQRLRVG